MSLRIAILYICINGFHPFVCMPLIFHRVLFTCIMHIVFSALPFLGIIVHVLAARFYGTLYSFLCDFLMYGALHSLVFAIVIALSCGSGSVSGNVLQRMSCHTVVTVNSDGRTCSAEAVHK